MAPNVRSGAREADHVSGEQDRGLPSNQNPTVSFDTSVAHIARVYDYWLGGKDNFAADREAAEEALAINPGLLADVRANRAFLARAVRYLAAERGIRQFLDIGTGIPTADNTHEVAQSVAPESRIVYVDNDPVVLLHAQALLASDPAGSCDYIDADLRDPEKILAAAVRTLDFSRPVAVMLIAILHLIPDADDPYGVVARLMAAVPPGSYLALSHPASDIEAAVMTRAATRLNRLMSQRVTLRSRAEVSRFFDGLALAEPGIVQPPWWRPAGPAPSAGISVWCGVARKD
jgi:S-adenosyl methyltransferase